MGAEYQQKFPETTIEYASLPSGEISKDFAGRRYKPADSYEKAFKAYQIDGK